MTANSYRVHASHYAKQVVMAVNPQNLTRFPLGIEYCPGPWEWNGVAKKVNAVFSLFYIQDIWDLESTRAEIQTQG